MWLVKDELSAWVDPLYRPRDGILGARILDTISVALSFRCQGLKMAWQPCAFVEGVDSVLPTFSG